MNQQLDLWEKDATDPRPRAGSGWPELDGLLRKQSFGPGTLAFLAGRMHTRKTAVMSNLIVNMLGAGVPVGLVGLDEAPFMYIAKVASAMSGVAHTDLDDEWLKHPHTKEFDKLKADYHTLGQDFHFSYRSRPTLDNLSEWVAMEELNGDRMRVLFVDYLSLLERGKYDGKDNTRIPVLCENLKEWSNREEMVVIALHQVGRTDDSAVKRYHGSAPITPEQLMYGGEQQADIILATYRPALDPEGNMSQEEAIAQGMDLADWQAKVDRVAAFERDTMLQLIKNRPGVELNYTGIRLRSVGNSQKMEVVP